MEKHSSHNTKSARWKISRIDQDRFGCLSGAVFAGPIFGVIIGMETMDFSESWLVFGLTVLGVTLLFFAIAGAVCLYHTLKNRKLRAKFVHDLSMAEAFDEHQVDIDCGEGYHWTAPLKMYAEVGAWAERNSVNVRRYHDPDYDRYRSYEDRAYWQETLCFSSEDELILFRLKFL